MQTRTAGGTNHRDPRRVQVSLPQDEYETVVRLATEAHRSVPQHIRHLIARDANEAASSQVAPTGLKAAA